jgi:hypothetical protein
MIIVVSLPLHRHGAHDVRLDLLINLPQATNKPSKARCVYRTGTNGVDPDLMVVSLSPLIAISRRAFNMIYENPISFRNPNKRGRGSGC